MTQVYLLGSSSWRLDYSYRPPGKPGVDHKWMFKECGLSSEGFLFKTSQIQIQNQKNQ